MTPKKLIMPVIFASMMHICLGMEKRGTRFWFDLEMSHVNPELGRIIEFACIITNDQLEIIAEGPNIPINQPENVLEQASDWVKKNIPNTLKRSRNSTITNEQAEESVKEFLLKYTNASNIPELINNNPLPAGNCVQTDLQFIRKYMPSLNKYLNYRILDVSTIAEMVKCSYPSDLKLKIEADLKKIKTGSHRALQDIRESIEELRYYRNTIFKSPQELEESFQQDENQNGSQFSYFSNPPPILFSETFHSYLIARVPQNKS